MAATYWTTGFSIWKENSQNVYKMVYSLTFSIRRDTDVHRTHPGVVGIPVNSVGKWYLLQFVNIWLCCIHVDCLHLTWPEELMSFSERFKNTLIFWLVYISSLCKDILKIRYKISKIHFSNSKWCTWHSFVLEHFTLCTLSYKSH